MSRPNALLAIALAALLVTAGCLGGITGSGDGANTDADDASVSFYVSDRPGAIDQFEHLNVTITAVGFHQADADADGSDDGDDSDDDSDDIETETTDTLEDANETATENGTTTEAPETDSDDPDNSTDTDTNDGDDSDSDDTDNDDTDSDDTDGDDADDDDSDDAEDAWVRHDVDNRTVDLTELQGANASRLADFNISGGEYDRVFVHVGEVEGTLENGEQVDVQLPSDRLQINKQFTAESGSNLSFVFDIMVHEAGNSGQYILRPVVSESGTGDQVEIDDVDADDEDGERGPPEDAGPENDDNDSDDADDSDDSDLELAVDGQVSAGETVTLTVTGDDDAAVANATVTVDGETVGTTDADGTIELTVPDDAEELEVTVTADDAESERSWPVRGNGGQGSLALPV